MKAVFLIPALTLIASPLTNTAYAVPLAINVKNSSKNTIFIFWDDSGRCGKSAKCKPLSGLKEPKNGLQIPPGAIFTFGADDQSVQIGDATTAHIFSATNRKFPSTETSTKAFSPGELSVDKDVTKSGVVTLNWIGTDLKKE